MELLKRFYHSIKELNQSQKIKKDLIECSEFLLDKLKDKDTQNGFKNDIIEFLKYFFTASSTVYLFNGYNHLFLKARDCILEQDNKLGIKLIKNFNGFIVANLFKPVTNNSSSFTDESIKYIIKIYFEDTLLDKVTKFCKILKNSQDLKSLYG